MISMLRMRCLEICTMVEYDAMRQIFWLFVGCYYFPFLPSFLWYNYVYGMRIGCGL